MLESDMGWASTRQVTSKSKTVRLDLFDVSGCGNLKNRYCDDGRRFEYEPAVITFRITQSTKSQSVGGYNCRC